MKHDEAKKNKYRCPKCGTALEEARGDYFCPDCLIKDNWYDAEEEKAYHDKWGHLASWA